MNTGNTGDLATHQGLDLHQRFKEQPESFTKVKDLGTDDINSSPDSFSGFFYPAAIWLDKHLKPATKNLLVEIYLLEQLPLGCIASNEHFAGTLNISTRSAARHIAELIKAGYLTLVGFDGHNRKLKVNFARLEPRQIGKVQGQTGKVALNQPRQTGKVQGQTGEVAFNQPRQKEQATMPNCPHNDIRSNTITKNKSKISIVDKIEIEKKEKTKPKTAQGNTKAKTKTHFKKTPPDVFKEIALPFTSETFRIAWNNWLAYRKDIGKPYKSALSVKQLLTKLARFKEAFALELIEKSIANGWQGLVFTRTGQQYQEWLESQRHKQGSGTRAEPKLDLLAATKATDRVCHQLRHLEENKGKFSTYPLTMLDTIHEQLKDLWHRAKELKMYESELQRITTLGNFIKDLKTQKNNHNH